jgi:hypothetical protein
LLQHGNRHFGYAIVPLWRIAITAHYNCKNSSNLRNSVYKTSSARASHKPLHRPIIVTHHTKIIKMSRHLTDQQENTFRTQAWNYFALHAAQRMQSFQYYVTFVTALIGGAIVLLKSDGNHYNWLAVICAISSAISFLFWKLDCRTRQLIKNAETALKYLDARHNLPGAGAFPNELRLFDRDDASKNSIAESNIWNSKLSYSKCFNFVFAIFGYGGAALALVFSLIR